MRCKTDVQKVVILELTELEADWLRGIMQNPFGVSPEEEDPTSCAMRRRFFEVLSETY